MLGISFNLFFCYCLLSLSVGILYAYFLYRKETNIFSRKIIYILFAFRTILITFLCFLLLSPIIKSIIYSVEKPIIILAKDNSKSIKDSINHNFKYITKKLKSFDVYPYSFSDDVTEGISNKNLGLRTNYSNFFKLINNTFENRNVAGLIFASDGLYNLGQNPEFMQYDFPIYSIALGDTNKYKDISIDNILYNQISFLGNKFPLEITMLSSSTNSETTKLSVWKSGKQIYEESIYFSTEKNIQKINILLDADKLGVNKFEIRLNPLNEERNIVNNTRNFFVDVIDSKYNVIILEDKAHPDLAAFKSVIDQNKNYNLEIKKFDEKIITDKYQLVVLFGVDKIPSYLISSKVPLIVFNSNQSIFNSLGSSITFKSKGTYEDIFAEVNSTFSKFTISSELKDLINNAPPLYSTFGKFNKVQKIDILLSIKKYDIVTDKPIIFIEDIDDKKVAFITAEGWWKWKYFDFALNQNNDRFNELFLKLVQFLVIQEDKSLFRVSYDKIYQQDSDIKIEAELYNESYELINTNDIELVIFDSKKNEFKFQFTKIDNKYTVQIGLLPVGSYNFIAKVKNTEFSFNGRFDVQEIKLEEMFLVADHHILSTISSLSGGDIYYQNQVEDLLNTIIKNTRNKSIINEKEKYDNLINFNWILVVLLLLISFEWFLRKYNGTL